jgi:hypothetical protein
MPQEFEVPALEYDDTQMLSVFRARRREVPPAPLTEVLVPRVEALLRLVALWGDDVGEDWNLGDHRYLILDFTSGDAVLYVQFWSEPHDVLLVEVSSGNWNPPAHLLVGPVQKKALRALGYRIGGKARNYQKDVPVSDASLGVLAAEVVHILVDVLGYRGLTRLRGEVLAQTGDREAIVHDAVSPEDVAKLLTLLHLDVSGNVGSAAEPRLTALAPTGEELVVRLMDRVGRLNAFKRVVLLREQEEGAAFATLEVDGGVTTRYLHKQLAGLVGALLDESE